MSYKEELIEDYFNKTAYLLAQQFDFAAGKISAENLIDTTLVILLESVMETEKTKDTEALETIAEVFGDVVGDLPWFKDWLEVEYENFMVRRFGGKKERLEYKELKIYANAIKMAIIRRHSRNSR